MSQDNNDSTADIPVRSGRASCGNVEIAYEDWGDLQHPPLLLIMGLGAQMLFWPDDFCRQLVQRGFRVIRFDNRDVGQSTHTVEQCKTPFLWLMARAQLGIQTKVPYSLVDMAADAAGVLDALHITRAHVIGASMGGMIAQVFAAQYPQRVESLIIFFSSTNQPLLPPLSPSLLFGFFRRPPEGATLAQQKQQQKDLLHAIGSRTYPADDAGLSLLLDHVYARGVDPEGPRRQFCAVLGTGDLRRFSKTIQAPTLVIHGTEDRLVSRAAGKAIQKAIVGAKMEIIPGMAHDLPYPLWPLFIDLIAEHIDSSSQS